VGRKGNQLAISRPAATEAQPQSQPQSQPQPQAMTKGALTPEAVRMLRALATMQAEAIKDSRWVGESFAEESRAMHYGEREQEIIHGQATIEEAQELLEEGIAVAPLPFPVVPPEKAN